MDSLSAMATQAAKVVWGDGDEHKEPLSGAQGDVSRGEPYDAGNMNASDQQRLSDETSGADLAAPARTDRDKTRDSEHEPDAEQDADPSPASVHDGSGSRSSEGAEPGPRPLQTPAKVQSGDASKRESDDAAPGPDNGHAKGTGEHFVRTTGFAADGGDFDATKPGAGREADRLMEEKGAHREGGTADTDKKAKPRLGERIKNKLHKH